MSSQFNEMIQHLKESSAIKFLFQHTALAKLLNQETPPSPWNFFQTYFSSWWLTRLWTYDLKNPYYNNFNKFVLSTTHLKNSKLYNEENVNTFSKHDVDDFYFALVKLNDAKLLTQTNFTIVVHHAKPSHLARAFSSLHEAGILTEANRADVVHHADPDDLALAFSSLHEAGILTEANRADVVHHTNLGNLSLALSELQNSGILTEANRDVVTHHARPCSLSLALSELQDSGFLTEANRAVVANHPRPDGLVAVLRRLHEAGILTEANRAVIAHHAYPWRLSDALSSLHEAGILTEANVAVVAHHANPNGLAKALSYLQGAGILTEANFTVLVAPNHASLVSEQANQLIWSRIPRFLLTQANFERLVIASEHANPMAELQRVRDQILGVQAQAGHAAPFNPNQSTHTASVHRSVSESATRLRESYGAGLNLKTKIQEIKDYVNDLDNSPKHLAAKRCIERITAWDSTLWYSTFTDSSGVSTHQLLALSYMAIHDESKRNGTLEDALSLFVEGLYEIQRGYNLNDVGEELGGEDRPICSAGTFNKLMEKLNGIHSDVEVYYITQEGACAKFPKLVEHHALNYLNGLARPETATDYLATKELLDSMQDNGIEPIWDKIKAGVEAELWSEFKEAYANNPNHHKFKEIMDNSKDCNAPDLREVYSKLEASPGYQACLIILFSLHEHSLWANRQENDDVQDAFDKQFAPSR